jgi:hypothetical protein
MTLTFSRIIDFDDATNLFLKHKAYLNVLVVISKLLGQFILGMRQLPRMNIFVLKKDWLRHQNQ